MRHQWDSLRAGVRSSNLLLSIVSFLALFLLFCLNEEAWMFFGLVLLQAWGYVSSCALVDEMEYD